MDWRSRGALKRQTGFDSIYLAKKGASDDRVKYSMITKSISENWDKLGLRSNCLNLCSFEAVT